MGRIWTAPFRIIIPENTAVKPISNNRGSAPYEEIYNFKIFPSVDIDGSPLDCNFINPPCVRGRSRWVCGQGGQFDSVSRLGEIVRRKTGGSFYRLSRGGSAETSSHR